MCVCDWVLSDVYQSDMIIYVWDRPLTSPSDRRDQGSNLEPLTSVSICNFPNVAWITGARHNAQLCLHSHIVLFATNECRGRQHFAA